LQIFIDVSEECDVAYFRIEAAYSSDVSVFRIYLRRHISSTFYLVIFLILRQYNTDYPYSHLHYTRTSEVNLVFRSFPVNIDELLFRLQYRGRVSKQVTNGSKTAVMDVIGFLCVSLGSSTVQPRDTIGSRRAGAYSVAGFRNQNGSRA
jgi:hypothetical protein